MQSKFSLAPRFKIIGLVLFIPFLVLGILVNYFEFTFAFLKLRGAEEAFLSSSNYNLTDEIVLTGLIISLLMIAFAREKNEDEFIHHLRLESWQWAVLFNFFLLLIATWLFYGDNFFQVMMYNMLTVPILFILRFHFVLFRNRRHELKNAAA